MPEFDNERLELAGRLRRQLAVENELSRPQARAFVRCLQITWQVPTIEWAHEESEEQLSDARRLLHAAQIFLEIEGAGSLGAIACYRRAGELLEWLTRASDHIRTVVPIEILAAAAYQLGGLPAMAAALLAQIETEHEGIALYASFLRGNFDDVLRRSTDFWRQHYDLTQADASYRLGHPELDRSDDENRIVWLFTVELVRCLGLVAASLRRGDDERTSTAIKKLQALDAMALRIFSDDAALIVSLLAQVAEVYWKASIYRPLLALSNLNEEYRPRLLRYARGQFSRGRGILWTSQIQGLDRLLKDSSFALCTPTGSGKTLVANVALIKELILRGGDAAQAPLAIYLVPSRALAGEVEGKLRAELGDDMIVTGLYGGADWGITDYWLSGEEPTVLIVTVEKAEALMRYVGQLLLNRLRLIVIDEAHQVVPVNNENTRTSFADHSSRSLRLESLVSRILARRPDVVRIALTAVAGGAAGPVARWVEGTADAEAIGVNYRSTRQVIGTLETTPNRPGRILLDIMNGRPLYVRGQDSPVYLPLRAAAMPSLPATIRGSLNHFNCLAVLWMALHLAEENQRILISVAQEPEQTMRWFKEALELSTWVNAPVFTAPIDELRERYDEALATCADYCGENSFEFALLKRGIVTSHGQMPQRLRRLMVEMIDLRICPIAVATATLTEGVNLPFDVIFLTSLLRRSWDAQNQRSIEEPLSTAEFRNLAGRAGRPGSAKGVEGMTLIAIPTAVSTTAPASIRVQRIQLRNLQRDYDRLLEALLIEEKEADAVESPLDMLFAAIRGRAIQLLGIRPSQFLEWLEKVRPSDISAEAGQGDASPRARLADTVDELDGVLLSVLEELSRGDTEAMTGAQAEAYLGDVWHKTFTAVAASRERSMEEAFIRRGRAVVETIYPDPDERRRLYEYGFCPVVGRRFEKIAPQLSEIITSAEEYGTDTPDTRFQFFVKACDLLKNDRGFGFRVRTTIADQTLLSNWEAVLAWWLQRPDFESPEAENLRGWQRFVTENLEFRLGVALGAVVAQAWSSGADDPNAVPSLQEWRQTTGMPWFGFWARELLRWGTLDPFVAFVLSQGLADTRESAGERLQEFEAWLTAHKADIEPEDYIDPQLFLRWQNALPRKPRSRVRFQPRPARLTGTGGERKRYGVIPMSDGKWVRWLDPAGFELAVSENQESTDDFGSFGDDFELRTTRTTSLVFRTYRASR